MQRKGKIKFGKHSSKRRNNSSHGRCFLCAASTPINKSYSKRKGVNKRAINLKNIDLLI